MLRYQATEKDCIGDEGEAQECVICFEEFIPGVEMARLECLCKFHKVRFLFFYKKNLTGVYVRVMGKRRWMIGKFIRFIILIDFLRFRFVLDNGGIRRVMGLVLFILS